MINVIDLKKSFGNLDVLNGITTDIKDGEKVVVIGPSGSGKSTFLRCLNCMEDATSGSIIFDGVDIADMSVDINIHRRHMGMVFQQFNLFANKTVLQNIMLAPVTIGISDLKKIKRKAFFTKLGNIFRKNKKTVPSTDKTKTQIKAEAKEKALALLERIGLADKAEVQLAYAIGVAHPVSVMVDTFGTGKAADDKIAEAVTKVFDLRPAAIIKELDLRKPQYKALAAYGHLGREELGVAWEKVDKVDALKAAMN